jgi:hypothetical protein
LLAEDTAGGIDILDAISTPFFSWAPKGALGPVIGPATPSLICACATPPKARPAASTAPVNQSFFMWFSQWMNRAQGLWLSGFDARQLAYLAGFCVLVTRFQMSSCSAGAGRKVRPGQCRG